jgi:ankyrin repeat protein
MEGACMINYFIIMSVLCISAMAEGMESEQRSELTSSKKSQLVRSSPIREFMLAAWHGDEGVVKAFLDAGMNINAPYHDGDTALHWAVAGRQLKMVEFLLTYNVDINKKNYQGRSALYKILHADCRSIAKCVYTDILALLKEGYINAQDSDGNTLLHVAAMTPSCCVYVVNDLLALKSDDTIRNNEGKTALEVVQNPQGFGRFFGTRYLLEKYRVNKTTSTDLA